MSRRAVGIAAVIAAALIACNDSDGSGAAGAGGAEEGGGLEPPWVFTSDAPEHRPTGDQSVFAEIDVLIEVVALDHIHLTSSGWRDYAEGEIERLPIDLAMLSLVEINTGLAEQRVPGLTVFANGEECPEVGNAGTPQRFSFQHQLREPERGQRTLMEIRYQGSTFSIGAVPLDVDFVSPAVDETVTGDQLLVRWTGIDEAPLTFSATCGAEHWPTSEIGDREVTVTLGEPRVDAATGRVCEPMVSADWFARSGLLDGTPFRSFRVVLNTRRIRTFNVE